jgi:multiple sugar transport system substrate-binding protein
LVAGTAPDVILFQDEPFPRYAVDQFADLDAMLADDPESRRRLADCWPTAARSFEVGGVLRGVPIMGGCVLIYCNIEAFERAGRFHGESVPLPTSGWTLAEFVTTCQRLTIDDNGDGKTDQFAFLQPHWVYYLPFIWSHGARLLDDSRTSWTLEGRQAVSAFAMYADLRHRWGVTPMPIEYAGQNSDTAFLSGRVAMCVNGPWFQAFLRETWLRDRYCVVPIPRGPGGAPTRVTWDALCVYAKLPTTRQADAWRFARFVLTRKAQDVFAEHQRAIPARRSSAGTYIRHGGGAGSPSEAFVRAMETARLQPITPAWQTMARAVRRHLTSVILDGTGRRGPAEAVAALASDRGVTSSFKTGH